MNFVPFLEKFLEKGLQRLYEDKIQYAEIKTTLALPYTFETPKVSAIESFKLYKKIFKKFEESHPDFKAKVIYSPAKSIPVPSQHDLFFETYLSLVNEDKGDGFLVGFDLTGPEESTPMLDEYLDRIKKLMPNDTKYFFHAGETNYYGLFDDNLVCVTILFFMLNSDFKISLLKLSR